MRSRPGKFIVSALVVAIASLGFVGVTGARAAVALPDPPTIAKAFSDPVIKLGATTTLTFTITNPNVGATLDNVAFGDTFPAGLVVATPPNDVNFCGGTFTAVAGASSVSLGGANTLVATASCTISVDVTGTASGTLVNTTGPVTSTSTPTLGPTASATLMVALPDAPTIAKSFSDAMIALEATTTLTFTITNPNGAVDLNDVAFDDNFPAGLVVATPPNGANFCGGTFTAVAGASSVSLSGVNTLVADAFCTITVDVTGTEPGTLVNTTGSVTSVTPATTGPSASATLIVAPPGDRCLQQRATGTSTAPGGTATAAKNETTATASGGEGTVTLDGYLHDPVIAPAGFVPTCFFDVSLSPGSTFTSVVINDCNPQHGTTLVWFNPLANSGNGEWERVVGNPGPTLSSTPPLCVSVTLDGTTSPNLSQLTGSVFAVTADASAVPSAPTPVTSPPTAIGGYWLVASDGGIFNFGSAGFFGSTGAQTLNKPVVGMDVTPDGEGYWLVASDGGIFNYGDAGFFGSTGAQTLNKPIVGITSTPDGKGYWLVASDGGVFNYGDAAFFGSTGAQTLNKPIVGIASTPDGKGYWLVASDGGIFNYGDAAFFGSTGAQTLNKPVVGMASTVDGKGYWLVASDGGIFNYGNAGFFGSTGAQTLNKPVVGMASTVDGKGYWLVASDGGIFNYGDAGFFGSTGAQTLNKPVVGMAGGQ